MIITDARGVPIEKPDLPAADAPIDDRIAYLRACAAYHDEIAQIANRAFDDAFRKALARNP